MKRFTKKQIQWMWFIGLWLVSLATVYSVAQVIRWLMQVQ